MSKAKGTAEDPYDFCDIPPSSWDARTYLYVNLVVGHAEVPDIKYSAGLICLWEMSIVQDSI